MRKFVLLACMCVSSAAVAGSPMVATPSGLPEAVFSATNLSDAAGKVAGKCMDRGWQVIAQTSNQVTCQIPFSGFKQALAGALLGNAYSTPPNIYAAFSLAQIGADTRAQARAWMETQMAFGQVRQMQYTDNKTKINLMTFLVEAGGGLPNGTVFNVAWIGVSGHKADTSVMNVTHVFANSPAAQAGVQIGDQITAVDGKSFKNNDDLEKRLAKVSGTTFPITIVRNGQTMTLTLQHRSMPSVGSPEFAAWQTEAKTVPQQ